jgi:pimeloyl-ACP methyl ester carboxylesterase
MNLSTPSSTIELTETFHHSTAIYDFEICWTSLGEASLPPLIFVHGTPWSSRVWHIYAKSLAQYFRVYLFDNPGFGDSPLGKPLPTKKTTISPEVALDADLAQQSEVFAALYKFWEQSWGQSKAHVVAHDHGGLMSLRAHLVHGCDYRSLCLIDVVALGPFGQPLFKLVAENERVFTALTGPVFEGVVEAYIRDAAFRELDKETMDMLKKPWITSEERRKGFVRQMVQANSRSTKDIEGRYHEVGEKIPVAVIWGKEDKWIPVETAGKLRDKLQARNLVVIDGAGHLIMYDQEGRLGVELGWWLGNFNQGSG